MLRRIAQKLKPQSGLLVLAIVLPLKQYVETNSNKCASELLDLPPNSSWEVQLSYLITHVLSSVGLELVRWTRVPYLCEGDFTQSFYYLNDLVLVLRVRETRASTPSVH
ncbi:Methyltransferase protein 9 [Fasciolopsis buskii]|uniref:Methyltransferase protein 9 n=1 Tax=Fasciolopsis buskii TaxID=27845 RepID=A0A8E0RXT5_9TREM|nr:Methyltransferase protein 9 [Fasciolopsis buski]